MKLTEILKQLLEEKKKKADRCKRIADRKYDKPSAYKSGAIVRCRQGEIWKDLKEYEDLSIKNRYIDMNGDDIDSEQIKDDLIKIKPYFKPLLPNYINDEPLTDDQINQLIEQFTDNLADIYGAGWMTDEDDLKLKGIWGKADINDLTDNFVSFVEGIADQWEEYPLNEDESLRKWFKRKGAPGKEGGWVDCNTCRNGKCKPCGRKKDEKRAKYPSCRPTPSQCKTKGKGKKWGKTK
jgi:hypothetical protein